MDPGQEQCGQLSTDEPCVCGTCDGAGNCIYEGKGASKPQPICLTPATGDCTEGAALTVSVNPNKGCADDFDVYLNAEDGLCPGGWYIAKPSNCKQSFVNSFHVSSTCVAGGTAPAEIHTSCSCSLEQCMLFAGDYILSGFSLTNSDVWYYSE